MSKKEVCLHKETKKVKKGEHTKIICSNCDFVLRSTKGDVKKVKRGVK